jgi:hypothetical protein
MITDIAAGGRSSMVFSTSAPTTGTLTERMRIRTDGNISIASGVTNGVTYFNSSKVLTSGTALTFDGTTLGVSSGSSTPALKLYGAAIGQGQLQFGATSGYVIQGGPDYTGLVYNVGSASYQHMWQINTAEQMRLTSTGLGIGTSSPSYAVDVQRAGTASVRIKSTIAGAGATLALDTGATAGNSNQILFITNAVNKWALGGKDIGSASGDLFSLYNYAATANAFTVSATNNFGIGTTSPSAKLHVYNAAGGTQVRVDSGSTQSNFALYSQFDSSGTTRNWAIVNSKTAYGTLEFVVSATQGADPLAGNTAMTLNSSGNLGIGTTSPAHKLSIQGAAFTGSAFSGQAIGDGTAERIRIGYKDGTPDTGLVPAQIVTSAATLQIASRDVGNGAITFATGTGIPERMRLDSSGNLLVGTTATYGGPGRINVGFNQSTNFGITLRNASATATGVFVSFENSAGGGNGSISQVNSSAILYNTSSDYRLKNITGPITTSGAYIDSLKPVEGTWKADGSTFVGLIAHETQEVSRTTVATGTKDGADMQGMDYSSAEIIANLIAELQSLRKRLAAAGIA